MFHTFCISTEETLKVQVNLRSEQLLGKKLDGFLLLVVNVRPDNAIIY
jgi:hypothetical protein